MSKKEMEIIEALKGCENKRYGGYMFWQDMQVAIAKVMGYKVTNTRTGAVVHNNDKVCKIVTGMENRKLIKKSRSGEMYKLIVEQ